MFDKTVCLLIDKRWKNRDVLAADAKKHGFDVEFFLAGDGKTLPTENYDHLDIAPPAMRFGYAAWVNRPNSYNAFLCFRKIITNALANGFESLLLLEDDAYFLDNFDEVFAKAKAQLPADWDMFYLGANHAFSPTKQISENILRLNGSGCFHGVGLRKSVFQAILDLPIVAPIDGVTARQLHPKFNCYACWPNIIWTTPGFSHCEGSNVDYSHFKDIKSR